MKPSNVGYFVGFLVGKSGQPDMARLRAINDLRPFCRKCRVSTTGERPGEFVRLFLVEIPADVPVPFGLE
jgi:hypothetical protein